MKFDVHRSNYPSSELGPLLDTIEAANHRAAQEAAAAQFRGIAVVVTPHRPPNGLLDRLRRRAAARAATKRDFRRGRR